MPPGLSSRRPSLYNMTTPVRPALSNLGSMSVGDTIELVSRTASLKRLRRLISPMPPVGAGSATMGFGLAFVDVVGGENAVGVSPLVTISTPFDGDAQAVTIKAIASTRRQRMGPPR
ncbi:Uncharacterised protein [Mycobacteroides abscessus subsp. abscessus]|nr:Uncharacterised protein [Mycobacteroides abscessus subsp. abscessus]